MTREGFPVVLYHRAADARDGLGGRDPVRATVSGKAAPYPLDRGILSRSHSIRGHSASFSHVTCFDIQRLPRQAP